MRTSLAISQNQVQEPDVSEHEKSKVVAMGKI